MNKTKEKIEYLNLLKSELKFHGIETSWNENTLNDNFFTIQFVDVKLNVTAREFMFFITAPRHPSEEIASLDVAVERVKTKLIYMRNFAQ